MNHVKSLGAELLTIGNFNTEGPQMLGATVKKFSRPVDLTPLICAPLL